MERKISSEHCGLHHQKMFSTRKWQIITPQQLSSLLTLPDDKQLLLIDSRSFLEFNTSHIMGAINVSFSKMIKRSLQNQQLHIKQLLTLSHNQLNFDLDYEIVVYDQCTSQPDLLSEDCFLVVLMEKLMSEFKDVRFLVGGLVDFQTEFHSLCETQRKSLSLLSCPKQKCMLSLSQPCIFTSGPTRILPFLFLGSQQDALSQEIMKQNGISYVLNVSTNGEEPDFLSEGHFHRIPINDSHNDKLLPHFSTAFQFIDKVREANGCVLVHCLAGISRSPTLAIAYLMKYLGLTCDEAYKYVKDKRPTISPNFNFLGQLLEFEGTLTLKSGSEILSPSFKTKNPCIGKGKLNCSMNNIKLFDYERTINSSETVTQRIGEEILMENNKKLNVSEDRTKFQANESATNIVTNVSSQTTNVTSIKNLPSRPSTLLHSSNKNLPKLNFPISSAAMVKIKPSPILEVPSPEENSRQKNVCIDEDLFQKNHEGKHESVSSHSGVGISSHFYANNLLKSSQKPINSTSSAFDEMSCIKMVDNTYQHQNIPQKFHYAHNFYNFPTQRGVQHYSHHNQRLKLHQQKPNRRFHHFPKSRVEYCPNYYRSSFHQPLYGFPASQSAVFPYNFSPGASHQCFPQFHSTQSQNMYLHHPCCQPGNIYFSNFSNYFNNCSYYNLNLQHYPNSLCGSRLQQHSFYASNGNSSFYRFPTGNYIFKEESGNHLGRSFYNHNSFSQGDILRPRFVETSHDATKNNTKAGKTDSNTGYSNGFIFSPKSSNQPTTRRDVRISKKLTFTPLECSNDFSLYGNSEDTKLEGNPLCGSEVLNLTKETEFNSSKNDRSLSRTLVSLPPSAAVIEPLSESDNKDNRLLYPSKKAPLLHRPNSIALQNIQLESRAVDRSFQSGCSQLSVSGIGTNVCTLPNADSNFSSQKFRKEGLVIVKDEGKTKCGGNRLLDGTGHGFGAVKTQAFQSVAGGVRPFSDENETFFSSLTSSSDQPAPTNNFFRKSLSSSTSSSSSSSRKSRSLENIINSPRMHRSVKNTCSHVKRLNRSLSNEKCQTAGKQMPHLHVSSGRSENDVIKSNQLELLSVFSASHSWQPNEIKMETGVLPSNEDGQNSLLGSVEVVKVS